MNSDCYCSLPLPLKAANLQWLRFKDKTKAEEKEEIIPSIQAASYLLLARHVSQGTVAVFEC